MANANTKLYASQGNGGKSTVSVSELGAAVPVATSSTPGTVKKASTVAALTIGTGTPAAGTVDVGASFTQATLNNNFATVATQINSILTALKAAGIMS